MAVLRKDNIDSIRDTHKPITGSAQDYDPLLDRIGGARIVLLGEATHGTHEFYQSRAEITRRLIEEQGFQAVAVEADWPDASRVNDWVQGAGEDPSAEAALGDFRRFPLWMWRNRPVIDFLNWMQEYNQHRNPGQRAGFYGLDLYSLYSSIEAVLKYLDKVDPEAANRARERYSCFEEFAESSQRYGYSAGMGLTQPCEDEVVKQLIELREKASIYLSQNGHLAEDQQFFAEQNAQVVKNAEQYYRTMFRGRNESWNLRDSHMAGTLESLRAHLRKRFPEVKVVVWAHNSHIGDARATEMGKRGEHNIGQLVREQHFDDAVLVGFTTYEGTVTAASDWDAPPHRKNIRPGLSGSYEEMMHKTGIESFMLDLQPQGNPPKALTKPRLERAIGVIYRPETERMSHYFHAVLPEQFDMLIHFDRSEAVDPLDHFPTWTKQEPPETFPHGV